MPYFGIIEDTKLDQVPGTVLLDQLTAHSEDVTGRLKHGTGRNAHIVLVPQPSEDPNDPLNWSTYKKAAAMYITLFGSILYACTVVPLLNAGMIIVANEFDVTLADMTMISGEQILVLGCIAPAVSAISRKYGKRALFFASNIFIIVGTIVCSTAQAFPALRAGRIIQGFGVAAYESLCLVVIGDLYFVHERGLYAGLVSFILGGVSNLSSVVCGVLTDKLGWRWLFHLVLIFSIIQLILQFLFVPETTYNRDSRYDTDEIKNADLKELAELEDRRHHVGEKGEATVSMVESLPPVPAKKTFRQELALWSGSYTEENLLQLFIATFAVCLNLSVLYVVLLQGWTVALFVAMAYVMAQIFGLPPYNLSASAIGYLSIGPFLGGLLGMIVFSAINDPIIKFMSRRNRGIYEPEYRLLLNIGGVFIGAGLFGFGYLAQRGESFYATATLHAMVLFGVVASATATTAYILDAFRSMSSEVFIAGMSVKNFLFYGFAFFMNDWVATSGPQKVFYVWGGTAFAALAGVPLMYIFGKVYRSYWARKNLLEKLNIRTHVE